MTITYMYVQYMYMYLIVNVHEFLSLTEQQEEHSMYPEQTPEGYDEDIYDIADSDDLPTQSKPCPFLIITPT